jgi:hypothetical protein
VHAGEHDLRHPPHGLDKRVIVLEQFADDGGDVVGGSGGANRLQVAASGKRPADALDDKDTNFVIGFNFRAELLELPGDRKIDRVERAGPVERDGGDRALDPEQRRIVGKGGCRGMRCRHFEASEQDRSAGI